MNYRDVVDDLRIELSASSLSENSARPVRPHPESGWQDSNLRFLGPKPSAVGQTWLQPEVLQAKHKGIEPSNNASTVRRVHQFTNAPRYYSSP